MRSWSPRRSLALSEKVANLALGKPEIARSDDGHNNIEYEIAEDNPSVSPAVVKANLERRYILVTSSIWTILAGRGRVGAVEISTCDRNECTCPLLAGLAGRRVESRELV